MTAKEIRQSFKDFFESKGHKIVPSAPMVIKGDPTLMFTNAGMNQFKDIILGNVPAKYHRVADSQKCLRVSGKHNDLEEVGHDTYHHTMFEMLGNWSFGDYFKEGAINFAWEYLTKVLKIDSNRLYVTVFEGKEDEGLEKDKEAYNYWSKHFPEEKILNGNKKDNFWEMGETGPCGPCSEIHIDLRSDKERERIPGKELVNKSNPQVIEIWNLVFMQYNRKADGSLENLPAHVIDTGMGFERLCMVLQGKTSNYDTDVFQPIIKSIRNISGYEYGQDVKKDVAVRVIADHIRTIAFSITDGQLPSNAKAGYVIRRILRRAVRYGYTFLDLNKPFMYKLLPALIDTMGDACPELISQKTLIEKVIKQEEDSFLKTLETGMKLLDKITEEAKEKHLVSISGKDAFTLYDTYGFPLDLTELILKEKGLNVERNEYDEEMQRQKERARDAASVETGDWVILRGGESRFVGYDLLSCPCKILKYRKIKQKNKEYYEIVLDKTPFYAEMGGQVGDTGKLIGEKGETIEIFDTKRENNLPIHLSLKLPSSPESKFTAEVNEEKRIATECNHTATHLLHQALREVLGKHVEQRGSYVSPENLRFDFSHFKKVSSEEIREVEKIVNRMIRQDLKLEEKRNTPIEEAKKMGAMALFGEKYGEEVRVVKYGDSIELCGGTHIPSTGMIGSLKITMESSVAAGVRRIEALTAEACENYYFEQEDMLSEIKNLFNNVPDIIIAVKKSIEENSELKSKIDRFIKEKTILLKKEIIDEKKELNGIAVYHVKGPIPQEIVKDIAFQINGEYPYKSVVVGTTVLNGKPSLLLMISQDLVKKGADASKIIKEAAKSIKGGGGGQPHFATAGGKDASDMESAYQKILISIDNDAL